MRSIDVWGCNMLSQIIVGNVTLPKAVLSTVKMYAVFFWKHHIISYECENSYLNWHVFIWSVFLYKLDMKICFILSESPNIGNGIGWHWQFWNYNLYFADQGGDTIYSLNYHSALWVCVFKFNKCNFFQFENQIEPFYSKWINFNLTYITKKCKIPKVGGTFLQEFFTNCS